MGKALIACEESQAVTKEMRTLGIEAYSCDIEMCSGGHPEWHIQGDVTPLLKQEWDMILAFPPCTYLTVTGNRWFNVERYGAKAIQRHKDREEAIDFFMLFANADCHRIAIENPVGVMSSIWRKPDQIIQPFEHGEAYSKKTCLWLKGLPLLVSTNIVDKGEQVKYASGKSMPKWYADAFKLPPKERAALRSKTFIGIAKALAIQYGSFMDSNMKLNEWENIDISVKKSIFNEYDLLSKKEMSYAEKQKARIEIWRKIQQVKNNGIKYEENTISR